MSQKRCLHLSFENIVLIRSQNARGGYNKDLLAECEVSTRNYCLRFFVDELFEANSKLNARVIVLALLMGLMMSVCTALICQFHS